MRLQCTDNFDDDGINDDVLYRYVVSLPGLSVLVRAVKKRRWKADGKTESRERERKDK